MLYYMKKEKEQELFFECVFTVLDINQFPELNAVNNITKVSILRHIIASLLLYSSQEIISQNFYIDAINIMNCSSLKYDGNLFINYKFFEKTKFIEEIYENNEGYLKYNVAKNLKGHPAFISCNASSQIKLFQFKLEYGELGSDIAKFIYDNLLITGSCFASLGVSINQNNKIENACGFAIKYYKNDADVLDKIETITKTILPSRYLFSFSDFSELFEMIYEQITVLNKIKTNISISIEKV